MSSLMRGIDIRCFYENPSDLTAFGDANIHTTRRISPEAKARVHKMKKDEPSFHVVEYQDSDSDLSSDDGFMDLEMDIGEEEEEIISYCFVCEEQSSEQSTSGSMQLTPSLTPSQGSSVSQDGTPSGSSDSKAPLSLAAIMELVNINQLNKVKDSILGGYGLKTNEYTPAWIREGREKTVADCQWETSTKEAKAIEDEDLRFAARSFVYYKSKFPGGKTNLEDKKRWSRFQMRFLEAEGLEAGMVSNVKWILASKG